MDGNKDESGQAAFVSNVRYAYTSVTAQIGRRSILLIDLPQPSASVGTISRALCHEGNLNAKVNHSNVTFFTPHSHTSSTTSSPMASHKARQVQRIMHASNVSAPSRGKREEGRSLVRTRTPSISATLIQQARREPW